MTGYNTSRDAYLLVFCILGRITLRWPQLKVHIWTNYQRDCLWKNEIDCLGITDIGDLLLKLMLKTAGADSYQRVIGGGAMYLTAACK